VQVLSQYLGKALARGLAAADGQVAQDDVGAIHHQHAAGERTGSAFDDHPVAFDHRGLMAPDAARAGGGAGVTGTQRRRRHCRPRHPAH
jgi:hypothetical protein